MQSSGNLTLTFRGIEFKVQLFPTHGNQPVGRKDVHTGCEKPVAVRDACPYCLKGCIEEREEREAETGTPAMPHPIPVMTGKRGRERIACADAQDMPLFNQKVVGSPSAPPLKQTYCSDPSCGKVIKDKAVSAWECANCNKVVNRDEVAKAYVVEGRIFLFSQEEQDALAALEVGQRLMIIESLAPDQEPWFGEQGETYAVVPEKRAEYPFAVFRNGTLMHGHTWLAAMRFKEGYEHAVLLRAKSEYGYMLMTLLKPRRHRRNFEVLLPEIAEQDALLMGQVMATARRVGAPSAESHKLESSRQAHFAELIAAKTASKAYVIPPPQALDEQTAAAAAQLLDSFAEYEMAKKKGKKKAARKQEAAS